MGLKIKVDIKLSAMNSRVGHLQEEIALQNVEYTPFAQCNLGKWNENKQTSQTQSYWDWDNRKKVGLKGHFGPSSSKCR